MTEVRIITPTGMFGSAKGEHFATTAMRIIGVGFGEEGDWCAKYGTNAETDVFTMRRFYCGDCDCGWGGYCEWCSPEAFTPSEVDAIHAAMRREEAAKQSAEMDNRLAEDHGGRHGNDRNEW